jgi:hypothetical protein
MLDFKQMTHDELNGSLIMKTLLPQLYKYSLNLLYVSLEWQFHPHLSSSADHQFSKPQIVTPDNVIYPRIFGIHYWELQDGGVDTHLSQSMKTYPHSSVLKLVFCP